MEVGELGGVADGPTDGRTGLAWVVQWVVVPVLAGAGAGAGAGRVGGGGGGAAAAVAAAAGGRMHVCRLHAPVCPRPHAPTRPPTHPPDPRPLRAPPTYPTQAPPSRTTTTTTTGGLSPRCRPSRHSQCRRRRSRGVSCMTREVVAGSLLLLLVPSGATRLGWPRSCGKPSPSLAAWGGRREGGEEEKGVRA